MWFFLVLAGAPILLGLVPGTAAAIPTISAIGSKFFDSKGNQFFIKGTLYSVLQLPRHTFDANVLVASNNLIGVVYQPGDDIITISDSFNRSDPLTNPAQCVLDVS